jgi:hypothetical protein
MAIRLVTDLFIKYEEDGMQRIYAKLMFIGKLGLILLILGSLNPAHAAQYESFNTYFIDLSGWIGNPVEGMDLDMGATKMIQAIRRYTRNGYEADAMIMVGNSMMTQAQAQGMQSMQMENAEVKVKVTNIDGYQVSIHHSKADKEGVVMVSLSTQNQQGGIFVFHYHGMNEKEGLETAKMFNWKKINEQALKIMK